MELKKTKYPIHPLIHLGHLEIQISISMSEFSFRVIVGAFHLGKKPGNFGGSKSGISDW